MKQAMNELRFIKRNGQHILQQRHREPHMVRDTHGELQVEYDYEWIDVPLWTPPEEKGEKK